MTNLFSSRPLRALLAGAFLLFGGVGATCVASTTALLVNTAPTLSGGPTAIPGINENTPTPATLVSNLLAGTTRDDVDTGAASLGIAVQGMIGNGTWQYSSDGITFVAVGPVAPSAALLLQATTQLRYLPDTFNGEEASLTFVAWDHTIGTPSTNASRITANTTVAGGSTAFSTGTAQAILAVSSVNDAPTDITLSSASVNQSAGASPTVGTLGTVDVDAGAAHSYSLVEGAGATHNTLFVIAGSTLKLGSNATVGGAYSVRIQTNDGVGGVFAKAFALTVVDDVGPAVTAIDPPASGTYLPGQTLDFTLHYSETVLVNTGGGTPRLAIALDTGTAHANYVSGHGTSSLLFRYTVAGGQQDVTGLALDTVEPNGGTLRDAAANNASATLPPVDVSNLFVDGLAPYILSVSAPANGTYTAGQSLNFLVNFSEPVLITGSPRIGVLLDSGPAYAVQSDGYGTATITFSLTLADGQFDPNGVLADEVVSLNGGLIHDPSGNAAALAFPFPLATAGVRVDATVPKIASVGVPAAGARKAGDVLSFTVNYSEPMTIVGAPRLPITIGASLVHADYASSTGNALTFSYTVLAGQTDTDGIALGAALNLNGATMKDSAGNDAALTLVNVGATAQILVDTTAPTVTSIVRHTPTTATIDQPTVTFRATFSEAVTGVDVSDFQLAAGSIVATLGTFTAVDARTYDIAVGGHNTAGTLRLDLKATGTGIADPAGNAVAGAFTTGQTYTVVGNGTHVDQTIAFAAIANVLVGDSVTLVASSSSGLPVVFTIVSGPGVLTGNIVATTGAGVVIVRATQPGNSGVNAAVPIARSFAVAIAPVSVAIPGEAPLPFPGGSATLNAPAANPLLTYKWQRNGVNVPGGTGPSLALQNVQPTTLGLYTYEVTVPGAGAGVSDPAILGLSITNKIHGAAEEVGTNIVHPNGNTYDQALLGGPGASFTANPGQITRISFIDLSDDIVQVEFSGAGTLSLVMDDAGAPAPAANYNQPGVVYVKGHAGLIITGANETTNLNIFTVGRTTAVNQSIFKSGVNYDGVANLAFVAIQSSNGRFGGIRTGNTSYFAARGFTGIYAPAVAISGPVFLGDISAFDTATPVLILGSVTDIRVTGGDLIQANARPVKVNGIAKLAFTAGVTSGGATLPSQPNGAVLMQDGVDVTAQLTAP